MCMGLETSSVFSVHIEEPHSQHAGQGLGWSRWRCFYAWTLPLSCQEYFDLERAITSIGARKKNRQKDIFEKKKKKEK